MFLGTLPRLSWTFIAGIALLATTGVACADTRTDRSARAASTPTVVYMNVGQGRIILPDYSGTDREQPYALRGEDRSDASSRLGERIYVGQGSIIFPAAR